MDELIEELFELWQSHSEAKAELKECINAEGFGYVCLPHSLTCDELKDQIKATIKRIVEANKGEL